MEYYDKLNEAINNSLNNKEFVFPLKYMDEINKLSQIIVNQTPPLQFMDYTSNIPINDSVNTVTSFFESVNPEYANQFQNILREKNIYDGKENFSVKFIKTEDNQKSHSFVNNGYVQINYSENMGDVFTIAHEITHDLKLPKSQHSTIRDFLGESSTISMEFLLEDYLMQNPEYNVSDISVHRNNRMVNTMEDAMAVVFENKLLDLYKQNGNNVTQEILLNYLNSMDKNSKEYEIFSVKGEKYLNDIVKKGSLQFITRMRYVIGTLLACDFHHKIKKNPENIKQLFYLIDILGNTDLAANEDLKILSNLDIPIVHDNDFKLNQEDITRLTNNYNENITDLTNKQENNFSLK